MKWHLPTLALLFLFSVTVVAQKELTLDDCYQFALKNNTTLLRAKNQVSANAIDLQLSKNKMLPTADISAGHYFSFGKNIDPVTNDFVKENFSSGSLGIGTQLNILSGLNTVYSIKQSNYNLKAANEAQKRITLEVQSTIALAYARLLYGREQARFINSSIELTKKELEITNEKMNAGKVTKNEYYQVNARLQTELADLITALNDSLSATEELKQLIGLSYKDEINIASLDASTLATITAVSFSIPDLLQKTLSQHPAIAEAKFNAAAIAMGIKVAKSNMYPSLSLRGALLSNYTVGQKDVTGAKVSLFPQLDNNFGQNISLVFRMPLFSQLRNTGRIKKEIINYNNAGLLLKETENMIVKNTIQLINDFNAAKQKYTATLSAVEQNDLSYKILTEKYKLGLASSLELITIKDLLNTAVAKNLQAKVDLFFRHKMIELLIAELN
jgi:outer membrane protein